MSKLCLHLFVLLLALACGRRASAQLPMVQGDPNLGFDVISSGPSGNLVLWVNALNYVSNSTLTGLAADAGAVGGWGDQSTYNHHLVQLGSAKPTYHATGGSGNNPWIQFGSPDILTNKASDISTFTGTNTFIFVCEDTVSTATQWFFDTGQGSSQPEWYASYGAPYLYHINAGIDFNPASPQPFMTGNAWHVLTIQYVPGGNGYLRVDGSNVANWSGNYGTGHPTLFCIGGASNLGAFSTIRVEEIRWYINVLSTTDVHTIEQGLGTTWGITVN